MQVKLSSKTRILSLSIILLCSFLFILFFSELQYYLNYKDSFFLSQKDFLIMCGVFFAFTILWFVINFRRTDKCGITLFLFTIGMILSTLRGAYLGIVDIKWCLGVTLFASAFFYCYYAQKRKSGYYIKCLFKVFYSTVIVFYLYTLICNRAHVERNSVYYVLCFLPFTSFFNNKFIYCFFLVSQTMITLISGKRTALIALLAYIFVVGVIRFSQFSSKRKVTMGLIYILVSAMLLVFFPRIIDMFQITVFDRLGAIGEDGGSGRMLIYKTVLDKQFHSGVIHWLIGDGYNAVLSSGVVKIGTSLSAHNDILEILYDYGIVGLSLYVMFFCSLFKKAVSMKKNTYKNADIFAGSIVLAFIISMTSHLIIYLNYYAIIMAFWGMCLAEAEGKY